MERKRIIGGIRDKSAKNFLANKEHVYKEILSYLLLIIFRSIQLIGCVFQSPCFEESA